jgi:acetylornithine/N-succinyldiaminopimelate aminotransferase
VRSLTADGFLAETRRVSQQLTEGLSELSREFGLGEVRGTGLLLALELGCAQGPEIVERAREAGLLLNAPRPHCLRFMPALNTAPEEVQEGLQMLRRILAETLRA